ncbi:Phenyloxazoline synthase MbtB [Nocardiopsis dassonvillei]|uniref:Phenyloxazoline synthase MbtB n=1 Tax=Nocardiopsis dassonvillei (strain ATCC 23218 / DSM 43111 / CIP 107115 / JCM 7437 / KCTC 9190 / NBRC 14626 / NCTC 10488 / NRRL B-5397 / IMRU 509) TaxID=446468 RepID=D7B181_NOCDD|nr:amino acid adenylation domain protein [Nocardiopsis dassonvillei subsp. dassonvillei DSM 43111]VEI92493.1 Phenyloxazoline synthase MbtB [Nocardiopsis dassonvillei]
MSNPNTEGQNTVSDHAGAGTGAGAVREQVAEVLGTRGFADTDDLFEHGLDSLGLIRLVGAWREDGFDVTFEDLSANPTAAAWSALLRGSAATERPAPQEPVRPVEEGERFPLATMQHAYWIGRQDGQPLGGVAAHFYTEFDGHGVDPERLASALRAVVERHPMLRVRFDDDGHQRVLPAATVLAASGAVDAPAGSGAPAELGESVVASAPVGTTASVAPVVPVPSAESGAPVESDGPVVTSAPVGTASDAPGASMPSAEPGGSAGTSAFVQGVPAVTVHDLTGLDPEEADRVLARIRDTSTHRRMDVAAGQVLDVALSLLPGGATRLHVDLDMIVADALSLRVLLEDLRTAYRGDDLPPLEYGFARYLAERASRDPRPRERARSWWHERLREIPPPPELPVLPGAALPAVPGTDATRSTRLHHRLTPERTRLFERRARAAGVTPAAALAAAFAEVLGAWSAAPRFSLNLPLFDRAPLHPDVGRVVGDFSSSVLLGVDTADPAPFAERARRVQSDLHGAIDHGAYGGVEVLRDLARLDGGNPVLAPVVYTSAIGLGPLFTDPVQESFGRPSWIISQGPQVLLDAQVTELDGGLLLNWDLRERAFAPGTMEAAFACYRALVEDLTDDPAAWSRPFRPEPSPDRARARAAHTPDAAPPGPRPLHGRFFDHARTAPGDTALVLTDGAPLTYGELADRALRVAGAVAGAVPAGATVALDLPRGADQVAAVLGVLAAGCAYLPLGRDQPAARRARVLAQGMPDLLICDDPAPAVLADPAAPASGPGTAAPGHLPVLTPEQTRQAPPGTPREVAPDALAYVLFTSGSTGTPKGVEVEHRAAAHTIDVLNAVLDTGTGDRTLALADYGFDMSVFDLFAPLSAGGAAVLADPGARREAERWARAASDASVTVLNCVPALLDMLLSAVESGMAPMPPLRAVLLGGDRVAPGLRERLRALAPECRFLALGGMTEAAVHSTLLEVDRADPAWACVPWGRPLPGVLCRVVDAQGRDRPDLVAGELWVGGAGLARGYRGAPDATADRFVTSGGRRWYRTGDLARYAPDGTLEFLGRADHQVKVNGVRVETGEVEAALAAHPEVSQAVAVALTEPAPRLAAVVVPRESEEAAALAGAAAEHARTLLPSAMLPDPVLVLDRIPLTPNGKPDRAAVARLLREHLAGAPRTGEPPVGETESRVARVWADLLGSGPVSRTDSFFALGGDSLLATRVVAALRGLGHAGAGVSDLFAHPVLADFAARLPARGEAVGGQRVVHDPASRHEPFPPTGVQRAYLTGRSPDFALGGVGTYHYTEFDGADVDLRRLEHALDRLVTRHDMLRAVFDADGDQRVLPSVPPVRVPVTEADPDDPDTALAELREAMSHQVLDPERWPLFDVRAVRYTRDGAERVRLGVGLDYLVLDALSIMTLYTELDRLYREPDAVLDPVEVTFRDYLTQVRPDPERERRDRDYWRERVEDLPAAPALPLRTDPADVDRPRFTRRADRLDPKEWNALTGLARAAGVTPATLLLACYGEVLGRWSGQTELSLTLTLFNRHDLHPHIGRVLGDFTSLSLTSYHRAPGQDPAGAARDLQRRLGRDLDHREVPAEEVLRELARRTGTAQPGIPVVFTSSLGVGEGVSMDLSPDFPRRVWGLSQSPQVYLDNQVLESGGGLEVYWDAVEELFRPGVLDAMFAAYLELLRALARDGEQGWEQACARMLPADQRVVRASVNAPSGTVRKALLHDAFFDGAAARADAPALVTDRAVTTHGQLADRSLRVAAGLVERGVRPGDAVAVCLPKGPDQVCAVLGVLAAGALYVPVGAGQPPLRRERIHRAARTVLAVGDGTGAPRSADVAELLQTPPLDAPVPRDPGEAAYTIFTSGSTGEPKGVEVSHAAALTTVAEINDRYRVGPGDRVLALSALDFDLSVYDVFGLLGAGGALVPPEEDERRDPERWRALCAEHGVTVWNTVPALLDMLLLASRDRGLPSSLRLALVSGDWVGGDLAPRLREASGARVHLVALGGATEAAIWSNAFDGGHVPPGWPSVPYGTPLRDQRYRVVDPHGLDCPDWVAGELWIGGAGVALGYRGDPERTAARFVTAGGERWYRTGDQGRYRPGALLEFLGRADRQVKVGGHRLELGEVEAALEDHPGVRRAAALTVGERTSRRVVAFVTEDGEGIGAGDGSGVVADGLARHLAARLPAHAVPGSVRTVGEMPLTANGKVDLRALEELAAAEAGPGGAPLADGVEEHIARVWGELTGAAVEDRDANFFALGGTSLLAIRMITVLRRELSDELSTRAFLAAPTLAALADQVRATRAEDVQDGVI